MSDPARFLTTLAQALSVMTLYPAGHPSRERVVDLAYEDLELLCAAGEPPRFTFLEGEVVCGRQPLRELRGWEWSAKLAEAGVGRLEFLRPIARDELDELLVEIYARVTHVAVPTTAQRQMRDLGVRFGPVGVEGGEGAALAVADVPLSDRAVAGLIEEVDTLRWMHAEVLDGRVIPLVEAEAVVHSLSLAMHAEAGVLLPLLQLKEFDQYTTTHSLNVSVLAMALAETLGLAPRDVRALGVSGLLHDVGKTAIPLSLLTKPGRLTDEERRVMNEHPRDGARIILRSDAELDLAAIVAYEHHIMLDGGGYPALHYARECSLGSRLVHVCDVYDALSTRRPYRDAWPQEQTLAYLDERAGVEFDAALVQAFSRMMRAGDARIRLHEPHGARHADP